ncbi:MAG TPA: hypothetical protein VLB46_07435 [Pyrinomonadaceae bacterium]|nr:hypothetical protein [Pyrinomonadaceae bacterium]
MPRDNTSSLLDQLDELKTEFTPASAGKIDRLLAQLSRKRLSRIDLLVRYHELLLFLRAYPHNASLVRTVESELRGFANRVSYLEQQETDLAPLEHPEMSGIAGTSVTDTFSFFIVRGLQQRYPSQIEIYWEWFESENRLAATWPRFMPLLEEDAFVEANVPYREWLAAARGRQSELAWLVEQFDKLPKSENERAELYDSQQLYVRWTPGFNVSRTGMRLRTGKLFYHREPLIPRREIDLRKELAQPAPELQKLSPAEGEKALDLARDSSTIRYRELYGFTHGDPGQVYRTELGRGVEIFIMCLPAEKRLPLRTYHAVMIYKNGVAIGYFEGLSLFERMESGFNLYYTFRDGETAWLYARVLNVLHHFVGVTAFSLDPYQIGFENEEGIASGAFWFYRKLGFRPTEPDALQLALKEEEKLRTRKGYRTSAATLRKLARSPMIFELDEERVGDWDRFQLRKIGFRAQQDEEVRELITKGKPDRDMIIKLGSNAE